MSAHATQAPPLPHWETTPEDLKAATREIKAAIRARIEASGRTVEEIWDVVTAQLTEQVEEIEAAKRARRERLAGDRLRRHRGRHGLPGGSSSTCSGAAASSSAGTSSASRRWRGTRTSSTTSSATTSSRTTAARATTSSAASAPSPRSTPSTGRPAQMEARQSDRMAQRPVVPQPPLDLRVRRHAVVRPRPRLALPRPHPPPPAGRELRRPRRAPRPRHARPVDDRAPTSRRSATCSTARSSSTTRGTPRTARPARSTRARRCAPSSAPSRAGPRCRTWRTTRACCTPSRSPRRWPT